MKKLLKCQKIKFYEKEWLNNDEENKQIEDILLEDIYREDEQRYMYKYNSYKHKKPHRYEKINQIISYYII